MLKKILIAITTILVAIAGLAWFNKKTVILFLVSHTGRVDVAPNQGDCLGSGARTSAGRQIGRPTEHRFHRGG
jgi:hypothetical protein